MRGAATVVVAVLLAAIATATSIAAYSWAAPRIAISLELSETSAVQTALVQCNDRITETARTGSGNRCVIPASHGQLTAQTDGLYYQLTSSGRLCDQTADWVTLDEENHVDMHCTITAESGSIYELRWRWPSQITISGQGVGGVTGFVGAIGVENCPFGPPSPTSPPYPPCPRPAITFDPTNVTFNTITVYVEFETTPGMTGNTVMLSRVRTEPDKVVLKAELS